MKETGLTQPVLGLDGSHSPQAVWTPRATLTPLREHILYIIFSSAFHFLTNESPPAGFLECYEFSEPWDENSQPSPPMHCCRTRSTRQRGGGQARARIPIQSGGPGISGGVSSVQMTQCLTPPSPGPPSPQGYSVKDKEES